MTKAIHVNSTAPYIESGKRKEDYYIEDFNLLTTILSALSWRKNNGSIRMYTDSLGLSYYESIGLTDLWDLGIDTSTLESITDINQETFWAGSKLFAIQKEDGPFFMMDTDFIVWKKIDINPDIKLKVIHREKIIKLYIDKEKLNTAPGYKYPSEWDWEELPCNGALMYFGDDTFKEKYTNESIKFMKKNYKETKNKISQMIFAEQRILPMVAKTEGVKVESFFDFASDIKNQKKFTHTWGSKTTMARNKSMREKFCKGCIRRISEDFPDWIPVISKIESLKKYL